MKKYELTSESMVFQGRELFRIKALVSFGNVKEGEMGGYIQKEDNLSQNGNSWVGGNARVYGNARVEDNAVVDGNARVRENALVGGNATVGGNVEVGGNAWVEEDAWVVEDAEVRGYARVYGNATVGGNAVVHENADYAVIKGLGSVYRNTTFYKTKDGGIGVTCGCFSGSIREFRQKVLEKHGKSRFAKEYLIAADLMELHFEKDIKTIS